MRCFRHPAVAAASLVACLWHARVAHAEEPSGGDPALAHELFDQGRALMQKGDYDGACEKFEESRRLDGWAGGGGTVLNLALCEEMRGKTGTAWALFRRARSISVRDRREDRQQFADEHIAALAPRLSRLRVVVPPAAVVPKLVVLRNGTALSVREWGEGLVVDPGRQVVEARAQGYVTDRVVVDVHGEGDTVDVSVPVLEPAPRAAHAIADRKYFRAPEVGEVLVGGAGLTAMAIGGVFGLRAINRQKDADVLCPDYDRCDPRGISLSADAARDGRISVGLFVGGSVLVAGAVISYFFTGRPRVSAASGGTMLDTLSIRF